VAAAVVVVVPQTALAGCGGKPSAQQVYSECLQNGGGGKTSGSNARTSTTSSQPVPVSPKTKTALKHAGKDGRSLASLVQSYPAAHLPPPSTAAATEPTAVGSAFDLGSGPTALLIVLAGTAIVLLGAAGTRTWRRSHPRA
jgi:hypothetical protein